MSEFRFEAWPTEFRIINQLFGVNRNYYSQFNLPGHEGLDIRAPLGSKIFAAAAGRVKVVNTNPAASNYGIHVRLEHAGGYETVYGHLQQAQVNVNQQVNAGDLLGLAGSTGNSDGAHLHLTLKKTGASQGGFPNNIIDPTPSLFPLLGWQEPAGPYTSGWTFSEATFAFGSLAQATNGGVSLRIAPARNANRIAVIPEGTLIIITGPPSGEYTPVNVANAAIGISPPPPPPAPPPPPTVGTVDGWGFAATLAVSGSQAVVGQFGINLRLAPDRNAGNIGLVKAGSTVDILGPVSGEYLPVRSKRSDFLGPVNLPEAPPPPDTNPANLPANVILGWCSTTFLTTTGTQATVAAQFGVNLRARPDMNGAVIGVVKGFTTVALAGITRGDFTPIMAWRSDVLNIVSPLPLVTLPDPLPGNIPDPPPPQPVHDTTPGWAFTTGVMIAGNEAIAGQFGINLRDEPRRDAVLKGFVPAGVSMIVTGVPQGEYIPVRVDDMLIQLPDSSGNVPQPPTDPDPPAIGLARIGLHASADPGDLPEAEFQTFATARTAIIKVMSAHSGSSIARLAAQHPQATWIVRAFLSFQGGRVVSAQQFVNDTIDDVQRALNNLPGKDVVIELHNEPNLSLEGLGFSWSNGATFGAWLSEVMNLYRQRLPGRRFIYPGLSPGSSVQFDGFRKDDHRQFIEASRAAVQAADGLGVHLYWSRDYPMNLSLAVLDDYINRFRNKPIWVTEASNNKGGVSPGMKGQQYLQFWSELKKRPAVQGVTYFVASASDPAFAEEVWVGRGIGDIVGQR